jgi:hypothetical protein
MAAMDDAENARAALRALWSMSGQMDSADRLGQEDDASCHPAKDVGTTFQAQGGESDSGVGFAAFAETNEPTFDRGEAASKFREAWKSQLAMDGKLGGKPLSESAAKAPKDL